MSRAQAKIPRNAEWNLACEPEATTEQLIELSRSTNNTVRELVAKRKDLTRHLFEVLSEDAHDIVRLKIAKNTSAPRDILKKLSTDPAINVVKSVARNFSTPRDAIERLSRHPVVQVRRNVVRNLQTPVHVLEALTKDPSLTVQRDIVCRRQNLAKSVFAALWNSEDETVRRHVASRTSLPEVIGRICRTQVKLSDVVCPGTGRQR